MSAALSSDFVTAIKADKAPRLAVDPRDPCELEVGQEHWITTRLGIRITKRSRGKKGEIVFDYTILDNRDRFLRRVPPATHFEADEDGRPKPPTLKALIRAGEESSYDRNPRDPMDAGFAVPPEIQDRFTLMARERKQDEHQQQASELLAAMAVLREVIDEMPRERKRRLGRPLWILRSRLGAAEEDLHRRSAA